MSIFYAYYYLLCLLLILILVILVHLLLYYPLIMLFFFVCPGKVCVFRFPLALLDKKGEYFILPKLLASCLSWYLARDMVIGGVLV